MKSLDLVKETIKELKAQIMVLKSFDGYYCDDDEQKALSNLEIVKQDLEVLEILKNKSVNISKLKLVAYVFPTIEEKEILKRYNNDFAPRGTKNKLTFKQYQKIKQWMEEE